MATAWWEHSKELRGQIKSAGEEAARILTDARAANEGKGRALTAEEDERFARIHGDIEQKNKLIEQVERQAELEKGLSASQGLLAARQDTEVDDKTFEEDLDKNPPKRADISKPESFFNSWSRWGALKSQQRRLMMAHLKDGALDALGDNTISNVRDQFSVVVDGVEVKAAMSGLSGPAGEYTIQDEFSTKIIEALKSWGGLLRSPIDRLSTATGADIGFLLDDDTSGEGEIVEENTAVDEETPTFSRVTMKAYTFSSKLVLVPLELLQDTAIDIETYLEMRFSRRIGRALNRYCTVGTGAKQPTGIVPSAAVGKTAAGTTSVSYTELLDLKHSVDPDYRADPSVGWGFNDATLLAVKKILDGTARPLWQASMVVGEPPTIDGDRYHINQSMASMEASSKPIIYGAYVYYLLRSVQGTSVVRLVERYAEKRQIGFFAFQRHDGQLLNPGGTNNPVKSMQMAA